MMEDSLEIVSSVIKTESITAGNGDFKKDLTHLNLADDAVTDKQNHLGLPADLDQNTASSKDIESVSSTVTEQLNDCDDENIPVSHELQQGLRILKELMADSNKSVNWPFMDPVDSNHPETTDYYERIKNPVWFRKMKDKFDCKEYENITEFVADFRLMLENCYRYNGPDHYVSKRGQKLETMMEQKLALLSRELREKTSIAATSGRQLEDNSGFGSGLRRRTRTIIPHDSSVLLNQLREEEIQREREARKQQMSDRKAAQEAALQDIMDWEDNIMGGKKKEMKAMWEIPQIGHFLFLCQEQLNVGEITQFELERCFYMPRESSTMQKVMTSLLSTPFQRLKIDKKSMMPYNVWNEKLKVKLQHWYKLYTTAKEDADKAAEKLGLDPKFYTVVGRKNPLEKRKFHEINVYKRVWIVKSLCDYCLEHQESMRESIETQPLEDQHDYLVGVDAEGNRYLHFPQFCGADLRIYKQRKIPEPKITTISSPCKSESPKLKHKETKVESPKELRRDKLRSAKKKRKKTKPDIPLPPTNRPSRLRQTIKTVIPVQTYSSSDEDDDSDSSTERYSDDTGDTNLNDSGICEDSPRKKLRNKTVRQLIENDNQSDTSSMDGEASWKRKPTSRLVRNGLMHELKNVSEFSMDESSMDKDETLSEKSFAIDTDSCNIDDSNLGSNYSKEGDIVEKVDTGFSKCVKELDKMADRMEVDSEEEEDDDDTTTSEKTKEFFKGLANTNIEREMSPYENDIDYDSPCTEGFEADDIEMNTLFSDVKAGEEFSNDSLSVRVSEKEDDSVKSEIDKDNGTTISTCDKYCDKEENETNIDKQVIGKWAASDEMNISNKFESDKSIKPSETRQVCKDIKLENNKNEPVDSEVNNTHSESADNDSGVSAFVVKEEKTVCDSDNKNDSNLPSKAKTVETIKQAETLSASHDHDYGIELKSEISEKKLDHDYGQGCRADIGEQQKVEMEAIKEEEEEEEEEDEINPDLDEFELIVESVEDLRNLVETFAEQEPIVIGKGKKQKIIKPPPRKKCVTELYGRLLFLLKELEPWEQKLVSATKKARLKLRKEHISYEEDINEGNSWELEKETESDSSDSSEEHSDSEESEEEEFVITRNDMHGTAGEIILKTEPEDNLEFDVSSRGRIRKRRVIPNNSEDQGSAKKKKTNPVVSSSPAVPHVPAILQRQHKMVLPSSALTSSQGPVMASQILLQSSTGNHIQSTGTSQPTADVRVLTGNTLVQPQQWASLLQTTAQHSQIQSSLSSKQASHPVIQQLLSARHPSSQQETTSTAALRFPKDAVETGAQNQGSVQQTSTLQLTNSSQPNKIQYYAANINNLPPAVVQQLIKSNALKFPAGGSPSGMVLLTTVNPQGSQGAVVPGNQENVGLKTKPQSQSHVLRLPMTSEPRDMLPQTKAAQLQQQVSTVIPSLELEGDTPQLPSAGTSVPSTNVLSGLSVAMSPLLSKNAMPIVSSNLSNPKIDNVMLCSTLSDTSVTSSGSLGSRPSTTAVNTTSPNRIAQKYANNVTVKTLLESRKPPATTTTTTCPVVSNPVTSTSEKPRITSVLHNTPKGIKAVKIPCQAVLDLAVKTVVTSVKTSLPTANIKVPSPTTMPSLTPRRNITKTIQSMKAPIPTTPTVESISSSSTSSMVTHTDSPSVSSVNMTGTPSLATVIPNQNILAQLQSGNGGQIILTNANKSILANVAKQQQEKAQKNSMLKFLPQNLQSSQGVVQGYLTPQGLIIPQAALQQQQQSLSFNNQLASQHSAQNPILQQNSLTSAKSTNTSQISSVGGAQFVLSNPVVSQQVTTGSNSSVQNIGQKHFLESFGGRDSTKTVSSWMTSNTPLNIGGASGLVSGPINSTEVGGANVKSAATVSTFVNSQPVSNTGKLSAGTNSQVKPSALSHCEPAPIKGTIPLQNSSSTSLLNISKLGNPTVSSYYVPTINMVNVNNQINPTSVSLGLSASPTVTSKPLTVSVAAYGGQLYPIVTMASAQMTNLGGSSTGSLTSASQTNTLVPQSPTVNVPQSPLQLTAPLLGQLTSPVANVGNIATVLGQLANPLTKTAILGQQGGNIQLLGQQTGTIGANASQIFGLQTQVNIPVSSTSNVIGQQLNLVGAANASQIIGQPLTNHVPKQSPSVVLGNVGQGSSSDLIKQLAAAQLLGSSQLNLTGVQSVSSTMTPSNTPTVVSGQQQQSPIIKPIQNQMLLQVPTSPTGQSLVRPQQQQQGGHAMLLLSPQKRSLSGNASVEATPSKQLKFQLNAPAVTSNQQLTGSVGINAATKLLQSGSHTLGETCQPKVPLTTQQLKRNITPVPIPNNSTPSRAEISVSATKAVQATLTKPGVIIPKTSPTSVEGGQNITMVKSVLTSLQNKTEATTGSGEKASQKLFLYNINGQLFTPQGVPVTVDNGILKVLPQSKPVTVENGMLKVLPQAKSVQATSMLVPSTTTTNSSDPPVTIVKSPVSLIPPHVLSNQQQKRVLIPPKYAQTVVNQPQAYFLSANAGLVTGKLSANNVQTSQSSMTKTLDKTPAVIGINSNTKFNGGSVFTSAQGQTSDTSMSLKLETAASTSRDLNQRNQTETNISNISQMAAGGNLKISQIIAQQSPMTQQLSASVNAASPIDKQITPQVKSLVQPLPQSLPTAAAGQGYIVMPNTAGQTQIIFPQANLNAAAVASSVKSGTVNLSGPGNTPKILGNVKLVKAADMPKTLPKYSAHTTLGSSTQSTVVHSSQTSLVNDNNTVIPQSGSAMSLHKIEKKEVKGDSDISLANYVDTSNGKVMLKYSLDLPVASLGMFIDHEKLKQNLSSSAKDGSQLTTSVVSNNTFNGFANTEQDSSSSLVLPCANNEAMKTVTENGLGFQNNDASEPKGAEKEEAALNLLSLANQAF